MKTVIEEAEPIAVCWKRSPVSMAEMFTAYSVMRPLRDSSDGGIQLMSKVVESTGDATIVTGGAVGTVEVYMTMTLCIKNTKAFSL